VNSLYSAEVRKKSVANCCKSKHFKPANIKIVSANSARRRYSYHMYISQRPVINVKPAFVLRIFVI